MSQKANRSQRAAMAAETVRVLEEGKYDLGEGRTVSIREDLARCVEESRQFLPDELHALARGKTAQTDTDTTFEILNETTLAGVARLVGDAANIRRVGVLNFASAKNPGGGFLGGSQAQEESLARSSGLYASLKKFKDFYDYHRGLGTCVYSDRMIWTPRCPVFRDDAGHFLKHPYPVDFISSPAPNAGALAANEPDKTRTVPDVLRERSRKMLALARDRGCDALVLGAWGCGVFRNDPREVASVFSSHLKGEGPFRGAFRKVVFSVLDRSEELNTFAAFSSQFGQ